MFPTRRSGDEMATQEHKSSSCARLGPAAGKMPTRRVADLVLRFVALFDQSLAAVTPRLGQLRLQLGEGAEDAGLAAAPPPRGSAG